MTSASKMFRKLGFRAIRENSSRRITYERTHDTYLDVIRFVNSDREDETLHYSASKRLYMDRLHHSYDTIPLNVDMEMNKAIQQQIREMEEEE